MDKHLYNTARKHHASAHNLETWDKSTDAAIDSIVTIPNLISLIRLCMAPLFLIFLFGGNDIFADGSCLRLIGIAHIGVGCWYTAS